MTFQVDLRLEVILVRDGVRELIEGYFDDREGTVSQQYNRMINKIEEKKIAITYEELGRLIGYWYKLYYNEHYGEKKEDT